MHCDAGFNLKIMFLKNYTSDVPEQETVHRIEKVLIRCGASGITKEYANTAGELAAVSFQIDTPNGKVNIRLPVDKQRALDALWMDYVEDDRLSTDGQTIWSNTRKKKRKKDFVQQAGRTAWKIVQDWVEVQMSMIQLKQADTEQVFLPYMIDITGKSFYQTIKEQHFAGLLPEKTTE